MSASSFVYILLKFIDFYTWLLIAYVILSWFPVSGVVADIYSLLSAIVEPFLGIFRRIVPTARVGGGGLDLSPLIAILVLNVLQRLLVNLLL